MVVHVLSKAVQFICNRERDNKYHWLYILYNLTNNTSAILSCINWILLYSTHLLDVLFSVAVD